MSRAKRTDQQSDDSDLNHRAAWFCQLEIARNRGDQEGEAQARRELELLGVTVIYHANRQGAGHGR